MEVSFFQAARRGDNAFFKYLLGVILAIAGAFIGQIPLGMAIIMQTNTASGSVSPEGIEGMLSGLNQHLALVLMLLPFVVALLMLFISVKYIHRKRFTDVLTGRLYLDWNRVFFAFGIWFFMTLLIEIAVYFSMPETYTWQFDWKAFLLLLPIALLILPLQTTFEEVLFRGYLMQGIGLLFSSRLIALLVTSICFGLLHFANPEIEKFGLGIMMPYYIGFGLMMGICTLMDEGTELALGIHAATNIYGVTIVSFSGAALETPTLFKVEELNAELMLVAAFVACLIFLFIVAKKYRWSDWSKLWKKIDDYQ